jgi:hypothetical protein
MEEDQNVQAYEPNPRLRWAGVIIGVGFLFATVRTIWEHGVRDWDWVQNAAFAALGFSFLFRQLERP